MQQDHQVWEPRPEMQFKPRGCHRATFKVATLVHQSLSGISPPYVADDCHLVADACERRLHSTASWRCVVTRTYSTFGDRAFGAAGPGLWNSLPSHLKDADISYSEFRRSLKTFLFGQWGHGAVWTVLTAPTRNILTYLLTLDHAAKCWWVKDKLVWETHTAWTWGTWRHSWTGQCYQQEKYDQWSRSLPSLATRGRLWHWPLTASPSSA